jgi:hypothetical protein
MSEKDSNGAKWQAISIIGIWICVATMVFAMAQCTARAKEAYYKACIQTGKICYE